MTQVLIRNAKIDDVEQIAQIHVATWQCAYKGQVPDEYLDKLSVEQRSKMWAEAIKNPLPQNKIAVAERNGKVIGFASAGKSRDEDADSSTGELYAIYIDQNYLGQGAGTLLMKDLLEFLKSEKFNKATSWVLSTNEKTKTFYGKKGWKPDGKTKEDNSRGFTLYEERYFINL